MTYQTHDIIPFPPLANPPRWASAPPLDEKRMLRLLSLAEEAHRNVVEIRQAIPDAGEISGVSYCSDPMASLINDLEDLECPSDQFAMKWKYDLLGLAREANDKLNRCIQAVIKLQGMSKKGTSYDNWLGAAQQLVEEAHGCSREINHELELKWHELYVSATG